MVSSWRRLARSQSFYPQSPTPLPFQRNVQMPVHSSKIGTSFTISRRQYCESKPARSLRRPVVYARYQVPNCHIPPKKKTKITTKKALQRKMTRNGINHPQKCTGRIDFSFRIRCGVELGVTQLKDCEGRMVSSSCSSCRNCGN